MEIEINDTKITLRQSFRSYIIYEQITEKPFEVKGISDILLYFYCTVMASKKDIDLEFEDFVDWLDHHDGTLEEFVQWTKDNDKTQVSLSAPPKEQPSDNGDGSKKKE